MTLVISLPLASKYCSGGSLYYNTTQGALYNNNKEGKLQHSFKRKNKNKKYSYIWCHYCYLEGSENI